MLKKGIIKGFSVLVVLSLAVFAGFAGSASANLLLNPSFKTGSGMPEGWSRTKNRHFYSEKQTLGLFGNILWSS